MYRIADFKRGKQVHFTFNGRRITGFENESLASAILASDNTVLSRSIRFHRPRTIFCSTGECGWCTLDVGNVPNVHACTASCRDGLIVRSQNSWPSSEWDILGLLDFFKSLLTNTFYHRRFLYPKFMRQFYLRVLRRFTGVGRIRIDKKHWNRREITSVETGIVVVGSGLAGMSAAVTIAERGVPVILMDDREEPGGSWQARVDAQSTIKDLGEKVRSLHNLDYWPRSICLGIYGPGTLGIVTPQKIVKLSAKQIILAPGALDAMPLFVNNDLPGVMSGRLVERLINLEGVAPGRQAVLWSTSSQVQRMVQVLQSAGIEIVYQLQPGERIIAAQGSKAVKAAIVQDVSDFKHTITCDLIVVAATQPRNELTVQSGAQLFWDERVGMLRVTRDDRMQTSVAGVRVIGEAFGFADYTRCLNEGRLAGLSALHDMDMESVREEIYLLSKQIAHMAEDQPLIIPSNSLHGEEHVCFCEDVREQEIQAQIRYGYDVPELIKRRTAVVTGPCQGKFCLSNAMRIGGYTSGSPTARPPAKPVRLKDLVAE